MKSSTKEKRFKERLAWHELQIIIKSYRALGFDYIIKRAPLANICFGTTIPRDVLPTTTTTKTSSNVLGHHKQTMSPLMIRILPKPIISTIRQQSSNTISSIGNTTTIIMNERKHNKESKIMYNNFTSGNPQLNINSSTTNQNIGYGPLASKSIRFQTNTYDYGPSIYRYADANLKLFKNGQKISHRFKRTKRQLTGDCKSKSMITPGPGTYIFHTRKSNAFIHSFGGKRYIRSAVQTVCMIKPLHKCIRCNVQPPIGDYWQNNNNNNKNRQILCRQCMAVERENAMYRSRTKHLKINRLQELNEFQRFRDCSYYHQHENTTAAVRLMTKNELKRKFYRENYLNMFNM